MLTASEGQKLLRAHNRARVLEFMLQHGRASRAEIAAHAGISKVTAALIVGGLLEEGILLERSKTEGAVGRPAGLVELHPALGGVAGLDVQPHSIGVAWGDLRGELLGQESVPITQDFTQSVLDQLERLHRLQPLRQVVVALPAPVGNAGLPEAPSSLPQLGVAALLRWGERSGVRIAFENDVKLAAVAEHYQGAARAADNFALLMERPSGIGLGLFLDGRLYRGERGFSGEISLLRWPQGEGLAPLEELPLPKRETALAQLVSGLAVALDLSLLIVHQELEGELSLDLRASLMELVPPTVRVARSRLGEGAPLLGALREATRQAQHHLLQNSALGAAPTTIGR